MATHDPSKGLIGKKYHDMTPQELYQYELWLEAQAGRVANAHQILRDHMRQRGMDIKPFLFGLC
jgi:hypothetical protein